jgi:hypothetical protein
LELRTQNFEFRIAASQAHRVVLLACVVLIDLAIYIAREENYDLSDGAAGCTRGAILV